MSQTCLVRRVLPLLVLGLIAVWAPRAEARLGEHVGGGFDARLVRCADVTIPAPLTGCGSDPLSVGLLQIEFGKLRIIINGAERDATYTILLRSPGGGPVVTLGTVTTNHGGHGQVEARVFDQGDVASGFIVLRRAGNDQFVSGIRLVGGGSGRGSGQGDDEDDQGENGDDEEFDAQLVRCADVNVPAALSPCGTDPLQEGEAEVEKHGGLEIKLRHAAANATYDIVLRPLRGADLPLGTLTTDAEGNARVERTGVFAPPAKVAGLIVLRRNGVDQFVQGFRVHTLAAVLPSSRSVRVGVTATAFATIINQGPSTARDCRIALVSNIPATFTFQTTNPATNAVTGTPNAPVDIPAGGSQSFVLALTPTAPFHAQDVELSFVCANTAPAVITKGLNTFFCSASATAVPDIVALVATVSNNGIVTLSSPTGSGAFAVAIANVGTTGRITVVTDTGDASLPVVVLACRTDASGKCMDVPRSTLTLDVGENTFVSFGLFVTGQGAVALDPANHRIFVRFVDDSGETRGSTSVAVQTQ